MSQAIPDRSASLKKAPLFADLSEAEVNFLATRAVAQYCSPGQLIFSEGDSCEGLFVVQSGEVGIFKTSATGREQVLTVEGPGASVAELPVFDGGDYPDQQQSNGALESFIQLLQAHGVKLVVDVWTVPQSRRNSQFDRETLPESLSTAKICYTHLKELGGLRHPHPGSLNMGWRNSSFRGFADYMQTPEFAAGLAKLIQLGARTQIAVMCAEAVPWRCHRSLIADTLRVRGLRVEHITSARRRQEHRVTPFVRAEGTRITYPPEATLFGGSN